MSGVRSEPVQVWLNNGRPARFVWRERLYTVLSVLSRPAAEPGSAPHQAGEHERANDSEGSPAVWRCWLVTASPGRNVPPNTYRLCHDPAADRWQLSRNGR